MINEMARMRFQSGVRPEEKGALVITEDGFLQVESSEEFVDRLAALENQAVAKARKTGLITTGVLFGLGVIVATVAWLMGRIGGQIRQTITLARPIDEIVVEKNDLGGIRVTLPGAGPQKISLEWEKGEIDECETTHFLDTYTRFVRGTINEPISEC